MTDAFILMTALPPTKGHLDLINFANNLISPGDLVHVLLVTEPDEPKSAARFSALKAATRGMHQVVVHWIDQEVPQNPEEHPDFWSYWADVLSEYSFQEGDYIVASEPYGVQLAEAAKGVFMPYDLERSIRYTKASRVRADYRIFWEDILPEFRPYLRKTVTIFGAESVGKTTTAEGLSWMLLNSKWYPEWARPYLETVGPEVTEEKMIRIWEGQKALQRSALLDNEVEFRIQDTDLYSTLGYWEMWSPDTVPNELRQDAKWYRSDVYFVLASNIPFEKDPLRYGGDVRESSDQYWIDLCVRENLHYYYITSTEETQRQFDIENILNKLYPGDELKYQRRGEEYQKLDSSK
jgi:NadR type nicotinamide-nucleotide adenylyltransferase